MKLVYYVVYLNNFIVIKNTYNSMFRKMTHQHVIYREPYINGLRCKGFIVKVNISRKTNLPHTNMLMYTDHMLKCFYGDKNVSDNLMGSANLNIDFNFQTGNDVELTQLTQYCRNIYFPYNTCFATYEYSFPNISLAKNTTFVFVGTTNFSKIDLVFTSAYEDYDDEYSFTIKDFLLK